MRPVEVSHTRYVMVGESKQAMRYLINPLSSSAKQLPAQCCVVVTEIFISVFRQPLQLHKHAVTLGRQASAHPYTQTLVSLCTYTRAGSPRLKSLAGSAEELCRSLQLFRWIQ